MTYDRRSSFERRANLHYEGAVEDSAWIATEVIRRGKSTGWSEVDAERPTAAEVESILARYNIGYVGNGTWAYHPGGSRKFQ